MHRSASYQKLVGGNSLTDSSKLSRREPRGAFAKGIDFIRWRAATATQTPEAGASEPAANGA